ncbi:MAG TPA: DNA helicase RecQ [Gammaproteobacteria bacterium]|nr:DNA helicase RecQ [Gammaproteobacteria bacterium]
MENQALDILKSVFGYAEFRHSQKDIIQRLLLGEDAVVLMPTGGGKSLCYQIPAMLRPGVGIIVSPLIALMQDQVSALLQLGVKAAFLNSTLDAATSRKIEQQLAAGELDLLYVAPERLMTESFLNRLDRSPLALFAIDEAHCVSQWGHDFRPEYIQLSVLHQRYPQVPRIALTATADETTRGEIIQRLGLEQAEMYVSSFDRPNICYRLSQNQGNARDALLRFILNEHENDAGIVYCLSRNKVEQTAEWLSKKGLKALPYHAGLPASERQHNQHRFLNEDGVIIVATIAFGMGIDKPDVRFVAHLNLPKSIEAYYQETGRAGRDGLPATAWMMYGLQDVITLKQMMESSAADEKHKRVERHKLDSMLGFSELTSCRRQALLKYFGDHLEEPCGNCDTCLTPVETWDATVVAQKALSCVHRTGQRFGVNYLTDVLLGKDNKRIKSFSHGQLSVYGIGNELNASQWRDIFRQLIARNLLTVDIQGHGGLRLTEQCRGVLRGEQTLMLRKELKQEKNSDRKRKQKSGINEANNYLWEALRACRKKLSEQLGVPPYVIFHDASLMDMLERQPQNRQQFSRISGVGEHKLDAYADEFLSVIQAHSEKEKTCLSASDTVEKTLDLFKQGMDIAAIAEHRSLKLSTIYAHLAENIEQGVLSLTEVVDIDEQQLKIIQDEFLNLGEQDKGKLKPVYDALDGMFEYGLLRCVRASLEST